jgi:drug/metabolite transporter (DMT)-like permease
MNWSDVSTYFSSDTSITLLAMLSAFAGSLYLVCMSQVMKRKDALSSLKTLTLSHFIAAVALLPFIDNSFVTSTNHINMLYLLCATAGFLVLSRIMYFYAYAHTDVANVAIFSPLTPVYVLAVGYFILGETASTREISGLLIICTSIYVYFLPKISSISDIIKPFRQITANTAVLCAFLSTIPTAFAAVFQKQLLVDYMSPVAFSFWLLLLIAFLAGAILLIKKQSFSLQDIKTFPISFFFASALLLPLTHVLFSWLVLAKPTALALVLQRTGIIFQLILAYVILKERKQLGKRCFVSALIILGFYLILCGDCFL